jgi:hypothetical protein
MKYDEKQQFGKAINNSSSRDMALPEEAGGLN